MVNTFRKTALASAIACAAVSPIAAGQAMLEEVIVTAQKRAESLQDVPISVSALQGDKIANSGISNMAALADYVPNLVISDAPVSTNIYMRGMGSSNNQSFEQSVGMYIDGIYMGRGRQYRSPFMDIERVEVLRGPQGTLFGKNTVAGAVNVITASPDPDDEFNGNLAVTLESNDGYIAEGVFSGPFSDSFALRAAFKYRETGGYVENTFLDQDEPQIEELIYRITAAWDVSDDLELKFKAGQSRYDRTGVASGTTLYLTPEQRDEQVPNRGAFANIAYTLTDLNYPGFADEVDKGFTIFKDNGFGADGETVGIGINPESSDNDTDNLVLNINYQMGEHTLTAITGYSAYQYIDGADVDWLPLQFIARDDDQEFDQVSQELRITSPSSDRFEYIAGAYIERGNLEFDRQVVVDASLGGLVQPTFGVNSLLALLTGGAYTADQFGRTHLFVQESESWAVFAQGTFHLSDTLRLTLGLRYTEESKEVHSSQTMSDSLTGIGNASDNYFLGLIQATQFDTYRYSYDRERDTDKWIPSLNIQWDAGDDHMLYATFTGGFKSGGFTAADDGAPAFAFNADGSQRPLAPREFPCAPTQALGSCYDLNTPADDFEFEDEEVVAMEIGGKHTLKGGAMTLNWAAFHTQYDNLQTSIFKGISFGVTNAAETTVQGLEVDMLWQASDNLRIGANASWLDASYDFYPTAPCTALQLDVDPICGIEGAPTNNDLKGRNTTFAPETSASVFFDYEVALDNGLTLFSGGEINYSDEYDTQGDLDPNDRADAYSKINLRAGVRGRDDVWELMLFGRNLTDEEVYVYSNDVPILSGSHAAMIDEGAVYGLRARYQF